MKQLALGILLVFFSFILFWLDYAGIAFIALVIAYGVLRGYQKGKLFYLIGGRSSKGGCCD